MGDELSHKSGQERGLGALCLCPRHKKSYDAWGERLTMVSGHGVGGGRDERNVVLCNQKCH